MLKAVFMPRISEFFGILIYMYYRDHAPPHFHAKYGEYEALICIEPPSLLEGGLPPRALGLVMEWASLHRTELLEDWENVMNLKPLKKIAPLV